MSAPLGRPCASTSGGPDEVVSAWAPGCTPISHAITHGFTATVCCAHASEALKLDATDLTGEIRGGGRQARARPMPDVPQSSLRLWVLH